MEKPLVAIRCITYNHEPYIRDALDGFVMQKTNFPFVAIVHDDASTDGTAAIIREYAEKYPDIIKPIYETENQYSKNDGSLTRIMNKACEETGAKYIALCEGDDYWIDPLKLQKQVDFLESHPDYSFCCHRFKIYDSRNGEWHKEYAHNLYKNNTNVEIDLKVFTRAWITQPLTAMIKKEYFSSYYRFSRRFKFSRDVHLFYFMLQCGKGISLNQQMGVYRWHNGGIVIGLDDEQRAKIGYSVYKELYEVTHDKVLKRQYLVQIINYMRHTHDLLLIKELRREAYRMAISYLSTVSIKELRRDVCRMAVSYLSTLWQSEKG